MPVIERDNIYSQKLARPSPSRGYELVGSSQSKQQQRSSIEHLIASGECWYNNKGLISPLGTSKRHIEPRRDGGSTMELTNYDRFNKNLRFYSGEAGRKYGINVEGEPWLIKFAKPTKGLKASVVSYTTSPLSEYLGSHIYSLLGIPVHETRLGTREGRVVVACKDFLQGFQRLTEFHQIKNAFVSPDGESNDGTGSSSDLDEVLEVIKNDTLINTIPGTNERFWDMFVVDALIGNPDRNNTNWGFVSDTEDLGGGLTFIDRFTLAPVYGNGSAFFDKRDDALFEKRLEEAELDQDAFGTNLSFYTQRIDGKVKHIKPFDYLLETDNPEALAAVQRIAQRLDINSINQLIDEVPAEYKGLAVISDAQKEFYKALLNKRIIDSRKGLGIILERTAGKHAID